MNHSSKPALSIHLGADHLHAVLRVDAIRTDTLVQLVQHWAEPKDRDAIIATLDALAEVVQGPRAEGELDAVLEQVETAACMDTAQVEVRTRDAQRLFAEWTEVVRRLSRFNPKRLLPGQRGAA